MISDVKFMKIRWQLFFLISFLACACYCIWDASFAFSRGEKMAEFNWGTVEQTGSSSLADYCRKIGIAGDGKTPQTVSRDIFEKDKNPLICATTLEEAKKSYGLYEQGRARKASTQMTFMFIGAWLVILLALFALMKWTGRGRKDEKFKR